MTALQGPVLKRSADAPDAARLPAPPRAVRPARVAGALLVVLVCTSLAAVWGTRAARTTAVLVAATDIAAGQQITAADLATVEVRGPRKNVVPAAQAERVVGRTAAVSIVEGSLLSERMVTNEAVPRAGEAVVGVALKPGAFPSELAAGDLVRVVAAPSSREAAGTPARLLVERARVLSMRPDTDTGTTLVSLVVPSSVVDAVLASAAGDGVSLALLARVGAS